ncbi:MAG: NUDIX hydrolase [Anaerofustis stercorihominis]|nr:NUDIX hydrolase [Anaerofustis stercorihominis]
MNNGLHEIHLSFQDNEWPFEYTDHDRQIVRAVVFDDEGYFYFVRVSRDDDFGRLTSIETAGGGVETGEDLRTALHRELKEELGASVEILCKIGIIDDYYNLIHRHNINNYFLCRITDFGKRNLTRDETEIFHLSVLKLSYEDAIEEYEKCSSTRLGRLIANRELPVLRHSREMLHMYNYNFR